MLRNGIVTLTVLMLLPAALSAQGASAMAREFFAAHTRQDFTAMTSMLDTTAFALVREKANEIIGQIEERSAQMNSGDPARSAMLRPMLDRLMTTMITADFARVNSAEELKKLTDRELMERWLEAKGGRYQMSNVGNVLGGFAGLAGLMGGGGGGGGLSPEAQRGLDSMATLVASIKLEWQVVGETSEGAVAHVTYRVAGMTPAAPTAVLTFRNSGGRWRVQVNSLEDGDQLGVMSGLEMMALEARAG